MFSKYVSLTKTATRRMTSTLTRGLVIPLALCGAVATISPASANPVGANHSGGICKSFFGEDTASILTNTMGVSNRNTQPMSVTCPLTRNTSNSGGAVIYVDVGHVNNQTSSCDAYSYDYQGKLLAFAHGTPFTGSGFHEFVLSLTGIGKSTQWSNYSVNCSIPGNLLGTVYAIDMVEQ